MYNPKGHVAREAVSCRSPLRRADAYASSAPPSRVPGEKRKGFMVEYQTDADCGRCGPHWLTGNPYVCARNFSLYDYMAIYGTNSKNGGVSRDPTFNNSLSPATGQPLYTQFDPGKNAPGLCVSAGHSPTPKLCIAAHRSHMDTCVPGRLTIVTT